MHADGWTKFIAAWAFIAVAAILAIVAIGMSSAKLVLGVSTETLTPLLGGAAVGAILMTIAGLHFRRQSR